MSQSIHVHGICVKLIREPLYACFPCIASIHYRKGKNVELNPVKSIHATDIILYGV